jgi:hypothetical protein
MRIFDECAKILRCMHTTRFDGDSTGTGTVPETVTPSLNNTLETGRPDKFRKRKKGSKEKRDSTTPGASCLKQVTLVDQPDTYLSSCGKPHHGSLTPLLGDIFFRFVQI